MMNKRHRLLTIGVLCMAAMQITACRTQITHATSAQQGFIALENGDKDAAYNHFDKAVEIKPSDWKSQHYLARLQIERGQYGRAKIALEQALEMRGDHPETGDIIDDLARVYYEKQMNEQLFALLDLACQRYGQPRDFVRQGKYLQLTGDADGALLSYKKAVEFAGVKDASPYIALADFYESIGDRDNTILLLRQAYYITPEDPVLADRFRQYGIVPGPTVAVKPINK